MIQKKEMTQMCNSAGEYLAPKIKVKELRHRVVLCASDYENTYGGCSESEEEG